MHSKGERLCRWQASGVCTPPEWCFAHAPRYSHSRLADCFFIAVEKGRVVGEIIIKIGEAERKKEGGVSTGSNIRSTGGGLALYNRSCQWFSA